MEIKASNCIGGNQLNPWMFWPKQNYGGNIGPCIIQPILYEVTSPRRRMPAFYLTFRSIRCSRRSRETPSFTLSCSSSYLDFTLRNQHIWRLLLFFFLFSSSLLFSFFFSWPSQLPQNKKYFQVYSSALYLMARCRLVKSAEASWLTVLHQSLNASAV